MVKIIIVILVIIIGFVGLICLVPLLKPAPKIDRKKILEQVVINYASQDNYRQGKNDCGPFSAAAVIRILSGKEISSAEVAKKMLWRSPNRYTLPWGVEDELKKNGVKIEVPNLRWLTDEERLEFLEEQLSLGRPVILMVGVERYQHYISLLGFDSAKSEFYVYDSAFTKGENGLTKDSNGKLPGNRNYTFTQLITLWRNGGVAGFYKWYAVVGLR